MRTAVLSSWSPIAERLCRSLLIPASTSAFAEGFAAGCKSLPTSEALWQQVCLRLAHKGAAALEKHMPDASKGFRDGGFDVTHFPRERVRNFSIIAHVDHGKSTLADRLLELTGAIPAGGKAQYLDKLQVERERGITVKAQTASLVFQHGGRDYLLNLIDTPGHVDFSYEVSRSLAAVSGAVLLVDAAQGIQSQTLANYLLALEKNLAIVPVLNKCDLPGAQPNEVADQMQQMFDLEPSSCLRVSAKTGMGLDSVLPAIVEAVPPPSGDEEGELRMLLFDAVHDEYRGVICLVKVVDGELVQGDRITAASSGESYDVLEVGLLVPEPLSTGRLCTGQVGYVISGMKTTRNARVGDTWHRHKRPVEPLPGLKASRSMVYAGIFPVNSADLGQLSAAIERLTLNDSSVNVQKETSTALGAGFRCGFLGVLHMEVFFQRLSDEHGASVISTPPSVPYEIALPDGTCQHVRTPSEFPFLKRATTILEPTVLAVVTTPSQYVGAVMNLCQDRRGELLNHATLGQDRALLRYQLPLAELGGAFYSDLKSLTSGYAGFEYEEGEPRPADLVRLDLLLNGQAVDALARVVHRDKAQRAGRLLCSQMKELMDRQMYEIVIQAAANGQIIARETLKAFRKNVLAKCYGGDVSRKRKLLEKQKEGKKRLAKVCSGIDVPQDVFHALLKTAC